MFFIFRLQALCILQAFCRQVMIEPFGMFQFYDIVKPGEIYKFMYTTHVPVEVSIFDPTGKRVTVARGSTGYYYTSIREKGEIKVAVRNLSSTKTQLSYKSPDPSKEIQGHLGYVKDVDLVEELATLCDNILDSQTKVIERTNLYCKIVISTKKFINILMGIEFVLTAVIVYFLHRSFINIFEKDQTM